LLFVSSNKSGFLKGKLLMFDQTVLAVNGPSSGAEVVLIKDGFNVKARKDGTFEKLKPVNTVSKCD